MVLRWHFNGCIYVPSRLMGYVIPPLSAGRSAPSVPVVRASGAVSPRLDILGAGRGIFSDPDVPEDGDGAGFSFLQWRAFVGQMIDDIDRVRAGCVGNFPPLREVFARRQAEAAAGERLSSEGFSMTAEQATPCFSGERLPRIF